MTMKEVLMAGDREVLTVADTVGRTVEISAAARMVMDIIMEVSIVVDTMEGDKEVLTAADMVADTAGIDLREMIAKMNRAVFLDRDGTMIAEVNYLSRPDQIKIFPATRIGLKKLCEADFKLFIVSNQSGVGRGYFTMTDVDKVNQVLCDELSRDGIQIEKIYIAPEKPEDPSYGRKPLPQFLFDARDEFGLDLSQSFIIGDKLIDLECGWNAGVKKSILVRTGYGAELERKSGQQLANAAIVDDLEQAADLILGAF
jgi:D-glycero-D-manno-heptose 1,7-bisphosphate phosphatase